MTDDASAEAAPCPCCGASCGFVRFLARHPVALWAFEKYAQTWLADRSLALVAWVIAVRSRHKTVDYRALVDGRVCTDHGTSARTQADVECEFVAGLMARPDLPDKLARLLQSLEGLDFRVRVGLLKTWLHAGIWNLAIREAHRLRHDATRVAVGQAFPGVGQAFQPVDVGQAFQPARQTGMSAPRERQTGMSAPPGPQTERSAPPHSFRPMLLDAMVAAFGQCNLRCRGCYALGELGPPSATPAQLDYVIRQLQQLHVYHVLLIGKGEPFYDDHSRRCLFAAVRRHPQVFFTVYSNGTNLRPSDLRQLRRLPNLIPAFSIDGPEDINDWRRGPGVYRKVTDACRRLQDAGLLFGFASTVFNQNCDAVLDPQFVGRMAELGCRFGYYSLFITPDDCPEGRDMMLSPKRREQYFQKLDQPTPIPLIDIDGVEAHFGCRAKRGATVYVDALTGRVAPCIRAPSACGPCDIYASPGQDRLAQIFDSEPFRRYRADPHGTVVCEAFSRGELSPLDQPVESRP